MGRTLDAALAILNGLVGDRLARDENELATEMSLVHEGAPLPCTRDALARAYPSASPRAVVFVHGLMCTESFWQDADGASFGSRLAADLGVTSLYVRYNTGLGIAESGEALADLLERVASEYPAPLEEIVLVGHSMGGLVARRACASGAARGYAWVALVTRAIYVGAPHRGAPLERAGRLAMRVLGAIDDPYARLAADVGDLRSLGIKDLGDGVDAELLPTARHLFVAGALSSSAWLGDGMVPVASATYGAPDAHVRFVPKVGHVALARSPDVYAHVRRFCEEAT